MWSLDRRAHATLVFTALAALGAIAPLSARAEARHESHPARASEARPSHHSQPARTQASRAAATRRASPPREHPVAAYQRETPARSPAAPRPTYGSSARAAHPVIAPAAGQARVTRYGNGVSAVEHTIRPGVTSRTFMSGGHVLYTRTYESHVWHQFGRSFAYETFVPPVRYPAGYYSWAIGVWPRPVAFAWGWGAQPWYPAYGVLFTPYPVYMSPDQWMTDYIISQNMQAAYQAQTAPPAAPAAPPASAEDPGATAPGWTVLTPTPIPDGPGYAAQSADAPQPPQSGQAPAPVQPGDAPAASPPGDAPSEAPPAQPAAPPTAPMAAPPAVTPEIKAQLNTQIKVQLQERQTATATPATMTTMQSIPPALRPNHVFFEVVQPLEVPSAKGSCSLGPNDYIKRTGGMSDDDWKIPVVVELSAPSDCPKGLHTRIGLNDLNAMENEQEAQVLEALDAASKRMGPNGPPHPALIADGRAGPDPMALDAIRQAP